MNDTKQMQQRSPRRLSRAKEITAVFDDGSRVNSKLGVLLWIPALDQKTRAAICVSKKHGGAVRRNRIKRVFRALIQSQAGKFPPGIDIVFLPSRAVKDWSTPDCLTTFEAWVQQLNEKFQRREAGASS